VAFLNYEYRMKISYSTPVDKCYFTIKSFPVDDFRQRSIAYEISCLPPTKYSEGKDSFGNTQIMGCEGQPHSVFEYAIKGLVETHPVKVSEGVSFRKLGMYKYPHGKCVPGESITAFAKQIADQVMSIEGAFEKSKYIMNELHEVMTYEAGATEVETTAEEAFAMKKGVCQDFAHVLICLLRYFGIPARYVCGLVAGEGQSHAWVEAACDGNFIAIDPTYNQEITDEYIKLGSGRDAVDCTINRGVMWGGGEQTQEVHVTVSKCY